MIYGVREFPTREEAQARYEALVQAVRRRAESPGNRPPNVSAFLSADRDSDRAFVVVLSPDAGFISLCVETLGGKPSHEIPQEQIEAMIRRRAKVTGAMQPGELSRFDHGEGTHLDPDGRMGDDS